MCNDGHTVEEKQVAEEYLQLGSFCVCEGKSVENCTDIVQGYNRERIVSTGFRTGEASVGSGGLGGAHGGFAGSPGSVSWAGWWVHRSLWYCYALSLTHIL